MLINQHSNSSLYREQQPFPNSISGQDCRAAKVEPICLLAIRRMYIYRRWLSYATAHMNELCKFEEGKKKKQHHIDLHAVENCAVAAGNLWMQLIVAGAATPAPTLSNTSHTHALSWFSLLLLLLLFRIGACVEQNRRIGIYIYI